MQIIETTDLMIAKREEWRKAGLSVGFVPTMGFLHGGHLSLVRQAHNENDLVVVSIFVNPLQFAPHEDLERYPRNFAHDVALLTSEGVTAVFHPSVEEMYPAGFDTGVEVGEMTTVLEGLFRAGHFRGVTTVVAKLFNTIGATRAYFGQKDAQQVAVVRKMVSDLNFPVEVKVCPTSREPDGLAMSSRNVYLNEDERKAAPILYQALQRAASFWQHQPNKPGGSALCTIMRMMIETEPLANIEYLSAADPLTLQEFNEVSSNQVLLSLAVRFGNTRLIDNLILEA